MILVWKYHKENNNNVVTNSRKKIKLVVITTYNIKVLKMINIKNINFF